MRFEMEPHVRHLLNECGTPMKIMMGNANLVRDNPPQILPSMSPRVFFAVATIHMYI
jgi:hypothetical protein